MKTLLAKLACVGILATGAVGLASNPAHGLPNSRGDGFVTTSCSGQLRGVYSINKMGRRLGYILVRYAPDNGGTYCAQLFTSDRANHRLAVKISKPGSYALDTDSTPRRATKGVGLKRSDRSCFTVTGTVDSAFGGFFFCGPRAADEV